jgi:hypothetical protein
MEKKKLLLFFIGKKYGPRFKILIQIIAASRIKINRAWKKRRDEKEKLIRFMKEGEKREDGSESKHYK